MTLQAAAGEAATEPVSTVVVVVIGLYLALSLFVGMRAGGKTTDSAAGYVAGDRTLGTVMMYFITGATIFSAFAFLGAPGRAYDRGASVFYILAFGTLGFVPFYFVGPRAAQLGRKFGFVTQGEMIEHRFRLPALAGVLALVSTLAFVPYLGIQMKGAGYILSAATNGALSQEVGAAITYAVVLTYVLSSGVLGVGWTNTLQGVFMMVLAWALGLTLPNLLYDGVGEMFRRIAEERPDHLRVPGFTRGGEQPWTLSEFHSTILVSMIGFSFWPHLFMKAFTAKSDATLRRTVMLYPTFQLFLVPLLIVGFAGVLFSSAPASPDQILPHMLLNTPEIPAVVVGLFCAGALAASMSSGDAIAHACASILVRDGVVRTFGVDLSASRERFWIRFAVVGVVVAGYCIAVFAESALDVLLIYAYGPVVQFAPVALATLYWRRATGPGVLAGVLCGIAVNGLMLIDGGSLRPFAVHAGLYGLVANVIALVVVSKWTAGRADRTDAFFESDPR